MIISRTPFRISFFGGGTDYPAWFREHGGAVLGTTIDKYCYLTCRYLPPFFEHRIRIVYSKMETCQRVEDIQHPSVRAVLQHLNLQRGIEIHHDGDLPARSGMGSSSAFTVGLLHALYALKGEMPGKQRLALDSIHIEQNMLKETVGAQDQVAAAYGGLNHITFMTSGEIAVRPLTISRQRTQELNSHLMLFYTGIERTASDIADSYVQDLHSRRRQLRLIADLVNEAVSVLGGNSDLHHFGELLHESWQAKRSLSPLVSNSQIEDAYETAMRAGAVGGKITGAGGGGFMLFFVPPDRQAQVAEKLDGLIHVPFKFDSLGSQIVFYDPEEDYEAQDEARLRRAALHQQEPLPAGEAVPLEVTETPHEETLHA